MLLCYVWRTTLRTFNGCSFYTGQPKTVDYCFCMKRDTMPLTEHAPDTQALHGEVRTCPTNSPVRHR